MGKNTYDAGAIHQLSGQVKAVADSLRTHPAKLTQAGQAAAHAHGGWTFAAALSGTLHNWETNTKAYASEVDLVDEKLRATAEHVQGNEQRNSDHLKKAGNR